ncbi:MAG: pantoate--beta-alanine ligase [Chitinophagaceae bacterium]|nr:pantoate--beta-alanine ligase [Chitinophagaceae bacterium]
MILYKKAAALSAYLAKIRQQGNRIGFVPTMGALHQGHISLVQASKKINDLSVCSIFVNPAQFNDKQDFEKYPSTIEQDIDQLEKAGCDILFMPSVAEMYPQGTIDAEHYPLGYLETVLEGEFRPGHFQGVCLVVHRLLDIVQPHELFLGQKDYQQCMVIKKLIELKKSNCALHICPTLRENDGLAMSSRNVRLSAKDRARAPKIYETLTDIKTNLQTGDLNKLKKRAAQKLTDGGFTVDYIEIANADNLEILESWNGETKLTALAAAFLGDVRLIDNLLLAD